VTKFRVTMTAIPASAAVGGLAFGGGAAAHPSQLSMSAAKKAFGRYADRQADATGALYYGAVSCSRVNGDEVDCAYDMDYGPAFAYLACSRKVKITQERKVAVRLVYAVCDKHLGPNPYTSS
jgi:hypothetical protein